MEISKLPLQKYLPQSQGEGKGTFFDVEVVWSARFMIPRGTAGGFEVGAGASSGVTCKEPNPARTVITTGVFGIVTVLILCPVRYLPSAH